MSLDRFEGCCDSPRRTQTLPTAKSQVSTLTTSTTTYRSIGTQPDRRRSASIGKLVCGVLFAGAATLAVVPNAVTAGGEELRLTLRVESATPPHALVSGACAHYKYEWDGGGAGSGIVICDNDPWDEDPTPGLIEYSYNVVGAPGTWLVGCLFPPRNQAWIDPPAACLGVGTFEAAGGEFVVTERVWKAAVQPK